MADVTCVECGALPFEPCTYVSNPANDRRQLTGKPIIRTDSRGPYYWSHNWRKHDQMLFDQDHSMGYARNHGTLTIWLWLHADILTGTRKDMSCSHPPRIFPRRPYYPSESESSCGLSASMPSAD